MRAPALLALLCSACSFGATTAVWEMNGYQDFLRGRIEGLSVSQDGRLALGPKIGIIFSSDQPEIWSVAQASDGTLYLGTGNSGRLYKIDPSGKSSLLWTANEPEIFAVAVDASGAVYAGTSPDGKIYRIENGKASEYFTPRAKYIWALKFAQDGALYVATGDRGKIFRVTSAGQGSVYYETGQSHVTCLAFDAKGRLLAGSAPNGILYRIEAPNKAFVLYDANLPEIRSIVPAPDGAIYAAALGGSVAQKIGSVPAANTSAAPTVVAPPISVTVTDSQDGLVPAPKPEAPKPSAAQTQAAVVTTPTTTEISGVERSAIYKIDPDNTVETLWSSKDENAYDLAISGRDLVFITDAQGRIYRLDPQRQTTLIAQANQGEATRLIPTSNGMLVATGEFGKILKLGTGHAANGWFESPVHDAGTVARWGRLGSQGASQGDSRGIVFKTRTGNSARPDATWSDWVALNDSRIASPNARYIQWRAEFSSAPAGIDGVSVYYLPQNSPPVVRSINVTSQAQALKPTAASNSVNSSYSITVTDSGDTTTAAGTPSQTISRASGQQIQISWQADDPEGDRLVYQLYFRGEGERDWKLLRDNLTENTYALDGDSLADGRYYFKVIASDRLSNPAEFAREAELISTPVLIDNTPPVVTAGTPRRDGNTIEIDAEAADAGSALRRCEYSIDAGPWLPVEAA
ncbi:MAG: hypothetical protein ACRD30_09000, partial [Bryobacteraceae bacterium]